MKFVLSSLDNIILVMDCGKIYERLYIESSHPLALGLRKCLVDQYVSILTYLTCVKQHLQKKTMSTLCPLGSIRTRVVLTWSIWLIERFAERELSRLLDEVRESEKRVRDYVDLAEKSGLDLLPLIHEDSSLVKFRG